MTIALLVSGLTIAFGVNITALSWIMKTLFEMRQEISGAHATFRTTSADHARRILKIENELSRLIKGAD